MESHKEQKMGFWAKFAYKEISRIDKVQAGEELFLLTDEEIKALRKIRINTFLKAGSAGALGVIVLFGPYYIFGETLFPINHIWLPLYDSYVDVEISFLLYSLVLVLFEIWYLTYINIKAVAKICRACGYPNALDKNYKNNINALISVGLEKKQKQLESIGINPYEGLSPTGVVIFQIILRLKATVSGILFKLLVKKALGRYALRAVIDLAGIPIYAFWNIWGTRTVMNEARIRVMAPPLIRRCTEVLYEEQKKNPEFISVLYDTLQLISESKRSFHYNHFLLSVTLLERFGIEIKEEPPYNDDFLEEIPTYSEQSRDAIQKLFVFGVMIDGALSRRERKAIRFLKEKGVLKYSEDEIKQWSKDYFDGKGIEAFFTA